MTNSKKVKFIEFDLENGLHCILYQDKRNPIVNLSIGYKVGSKDESKGKTGIAHLFEHMMFQGSDNIKKTEHFEYVMKAGGVSNAFTMHDLTVYYEMMPSNNLDTALWLESDRMKSLDITEENLSNQKSVVIEEKKQMYDNAPYGKMQPDIFENVFRGSNYEWPVIGSAEDINSISVTDAINFHSEYYSPNNSVLALCGDFEIAKAENLIDKYFSELKSVNYFERKKNVINPMEKDVDITVEDNVSLPVINICYQIPPIGSKEYYSLEYLAEIIANNKSSRLYKKLVYEKKLLKSVRAIKYELEDSGILIFRAMLNPGVNPEEIINEIKNEIKNFSDHGCSEEEFQKIRNQIEFHNITRFLKIQNIGIETIFNYLYFKDASRINYEADKFLAVKKTDVINSVNEFILNKKKLILKYLPKN